MKRRTDPALWAAARMTVDENARKREAFAKFTAAREML